MITERVRRAAASSMASRRRVLGGVVSMCVVVVEPAGLDPEAAEHLEQAVDLLDARDLAQGGATAVEQRGAQQRDAGVLGGLDLDRARQRGRALDPQVRRAGAEGHDLGVEGRADAGEHLEGEVLVALLDPVDRALAGREELGELVLGQAAVLAGVADEVADAALVAVAAAYVVTHADDGNSHVR